MIAENYGIFSYLFIGLRNNNFPKNFQLVKFDFLKLFLPSDADWAYESKNDSEFLGIIYGKNINEIFVVAYDITATKTIVTRMNDAG